MHAEQLANGALKRTTRAARPSRLSAALYVARPISFASAAVSPIWRNRSASFRGANSAAFPVLLAESRSLLWPDTSPGEAGLQRGKVHNLRAAARRLDRTVLMRGATFSFWTEFGSRVAGARLRERTDAAGGLPCSRDRRRPVPTIERLLRRGIARGLRRSWSATAIRASCRVRPRCRAATQRLPGITSICASESSPADAESAGRAGLFVGGAARRGRSCARHRDYSATRQHSACRCGDMRVLRRDGVASGTNQAKQQTQDGRRICVDEYWPEFDAFIASERTANDVLCLPIDGRRWNQLNMAGARQGFAQDRHGTR